MDFPVAYVGNTLEWSKEGFLGSTNLRDFASSMFRTDLWGSYFTLSGSRPEVAAQIEILDEKTFLPIQNIFSKTDSHPQEYLKRQTDILRQISAVIPENSMRYLLACRGRLDWYYSRFRDTELLKELLPVGLRLFGSTHWKIAFPQYPHETRWLSKDELHALYRASKVIFCTTKFQFQHLVHDRPMAVLALGGLPLTDDREDLKIMFEAHEMPRYKSIAEAIDLIRFFNQNEPERMKVIEKGRARIFRDHTYDHRAKTLLSQVRSQL